MAPKQSARASHSHIVAADRLIKGSTAERTEKGLSVEKRQQRVVERPDGFF